MIDLEQRVRDAFEAKADEARRRADTVPDGLARRVRTRIALNVTGVLLSVLAVTLAVAVPLRLLGDAPRAQTRPGGDPGDRASNPGANGPFVGSAGESFAGAEERAVITEDQHEGRPWRVVIFRGSAEAKGLWCVDVEITNESQTRCNDDVPPAAVDLGFESFRDMPSFAVGQVRRDVASLIAVLDDGRTIEGKLFTIPEQLDTDFRVAVLVVPDLGPGWVIARDAEGNALMRERLESTAFSFGAEEGAWVKLLDENGNYIGFFVYRGTQAACSPTSVPPSDPAIEYMRAFACAELRDVAPYLQAWWPARPGPDADDDAFRAWWSAYPITETLPIYE